MLQRYSSLTCLSKTAAMQPSATQQCRRCIHQALSKRSTASITQRPAAVRPQWTKPSSTALRCLHASAPLSAAPKSKDRGPPSKEDTQTDFNALDILSSTPIPTTAIDACTEDGFALNNGMKISKAGVLLVGGEALMWRPWAAGGSVSPGEEMKGQLRNQKGQFHVDKHAWGAFDLVWPKPDLLIIGTGPTIVPLSPETRRDINEMGIRIEVQDTRNASAQFNLLATERGVHQVVAAMVPIGWKDTKP